MRRRTPRTTSPSPPSGSPASGSSGAARSAAARAMLTRLLALADERGEPVSYALQRLHLCELELRAGDWGAASRLLDEWAESSDRRAADLADVRALPRAAGRRPRPVGGGRAVGGRGDRAAPRRTGVRAGTCSRRCGRAGSPALLAHEPARAAESLRGGLGAHASARASTSPACFPVAPELVEALAELGELDEAHAVTDRLRASWPSSRSIPGGSRPPSGATRWSRLASRRLRRGRGRGAGGRGGRLRATRPALRPGALAAQPGPGAAAAQEVGRRARLAASEPWPRSTGSARRGGPTRRAPSSPASARAGRAERRADADRARASSSSRPKGSPTRRSPGRCTSRCTRSRCTSRTPTRSSACARARSSPPAFPAGLAPKD